MKKNKKKRYRCLLFLGLCAVIVMASMTTTEAAMKDHQGTNTLWASDSPDYFHFPWSTSRALKEVVLPANGTANDTHYICISDYSFAWATQDLQGIYKGKMGISKKSGKWYANNYGYQSCTADNTWYDGNPFSKSESTVGEYGSRYLMLAVLKLQSGSEYTFRPVLTQGEGEAVFSKLYVIIHGYATTTSSSYGSTAGGLVSTNALYRQIDWPSSWFNYNGTDADGNFVSHYKKASESGSLWKGSENGYVTMMFRSATGDTSCANGLEVPIVNTAVDSTTTLSAAAVKKKGLDLGTYQYQFITYSPFTYTFVNNGTTKKLERSGCEVFTIPDMAIAEKKTGYHVTGLKITSGGEAFSESTPVNKNTKYSISSTYPKSKLATYCSNGKFYGVLFSDCTFETQYTANTYSVKYNYNGGTKGNTSPTAASFGSAFMVSAPQKEGYDFAGWIVSGDMTTSTARYGETKSLGQKVTAETICRTDSNGQIWFSSLTSKNNGTVTLTAKWTEKPGEAPGLYDSEGLIPSKGGVYGWFHYESVEEEANSGCFWAEDSDGDMTKCTLYAGDVGNTSLPNISLYQAVIEGGRKASIRYDFRLPDSVNGAEGNKVYTLVARDKKGNETRRKITICLDLTPPIIIGDSGTETQDVRTGSTTKSLWEIRSAVGDKITQTASDALSGIARLEIYTVTNQTTPWVRIQKSPFRYEENRTALSDEYGVIIKAWDNAGNVSSKFLLLQKEMLCQILPYLPK